uniref:Uncharacterized protein n=1 Tax=candidate division WOR-3 bacterium TaxID=2052148 RepID=A0A7C4UFY8_UNCW3
MIFLLSIILDERLTKGSLLNADFVETLYSEDKRCIFKGKIYIWENGFRIEVNEPFLQVLIGKENLTVWTRGVEYPSIYENRFPLNRILFRTDEFLSDYEEKDGLIKIIPKESVYVKNVLLKKGKTIESIELNLESSRMVFIIRNIKIRKRFSERILLQPPSWD